MTHSLIKIQPATEIKTDIIASFSVKVTELILNKSATLCVFLFDSKNNMLNTRTFKLEGEDYKGWGADDSYINTFIASKLGFTLL